MKDIYERVDIELIPLSETDVITTSLIPCDGPNELPFVGDE